MNDYRLLSTIMIHNDIQHNIKYLDELFEFDISKNIIDIGKIWKKEVTYALPYTMFPVFQDEAIEFIHLLKNEEGRALEIYNIYGTKLEKIGNEIYPNVIGHISNYKFPIFDEYLSQYEKIISDVREEYSNYFFKYNFVHDVIENLPGYTELKQMLDHDITIYSEKNVPVSSHYIKENPQYIFYINIYLCILYTYSY